MAKYNVVICFNIKCRVDDTKGCIYYSNTEEDGIGRLIRRANKSSDIVVVIGIVDHNNKMFV